MSPLHPKDKRFVPGDPKRTDSERLIAIEILLCSALEDIDKQETKLSRLEKAIIILSVFMIVNFGTQGISLLQMLGGTP